MELRKDLELESASAIRLCEYVIVAVRKRAETTRVGCEGLSRGKLSRWWGQADLPFLCPHFAQPFLIIIYNILCPEIAFKSVFLS